MGKRRESRKEVRVPIRIFGTDRRGEIFSEKVFTVNVSQQGVEVNGVQAEPSVDEIVGVTYGVTKVHFRVKWVGQPGTAKAGHVGLLNLSPEKSLWDFALPPPSFDDAIQKDRRTSGRIKCVNSAEVYLAGENAPIRTRTSDLSVGGCFLEMPNPLPKARQVRIALWVEDFKLWTGAEVVTSTPGFGIGVKFIEMTEQDRNQLKRFLGKARVRL
jgi:PilZ domain